MFLYKWTLVIYQDSTWWHPVHLRHILTLPPLFLCCLKCMYILWINHWSTIALVMTVLWCFAKHLLKKPQRQLGHWVTSFFQMSITDQLNTCFTNISQSLVGVVWHSWVSEVLQNVNSPIEGVRKSKYVNRMVKRLSSQLHCLVYGQWLDSSSSEVFDELFISSIQNICYFAYRNNSWSSSVIFYMW